MNYRLKLTSIANRKRKIHDHPAVLQPHLPKPFSPAELFSKIDNFHVLELGSGWGEFALNWIEKNPDHEYLALEVKSERISRTLNNIHNYRESLKIIPVNFNWFLNEILPADSFDFIIINFPDPWPKKKHRKHRLVKPDFPEQAVKLLRDGGTVYIATDYGPYARQILRIFRRSEHFKPVYQNPDYRRYRPDGFPTTEFEGIHLADGKRPYYMQWKRNS